MGTKMSLARKIKSEIKIRLLKQLKINILDNYVIDAPSLQTALNVFKGEWVSQMPDEYKHLQAGTIPLFNDDRIKWLVEKLGGIKDFSVLELGPLEAGHTFMLEKFGAKEILAVEANKKAFLKCLVIKEALKLTRSKFLCGDFIEFLRLNEKTFDLCVASGVLYHMKNPVELLSLLSHVSDKLFIWTHYYDESVINKNPEIASKFSQHIESEYAGFKHKLHRYEYGSAALASQSFCGGSAKFSHWLERQQILQLLENTGFSRIEISFENLKHENGPSFVILATKLPFHA